MRYRNIEYTVEKRPIYGRPHQMSWSGRILFPGNPKNIGSLGYETRAQLVGIIKYEIEKHFNRLATDCEDDELLSMARSLLSHAGIYKSWERRLQASQEQRPLKEMTREELCDVVDAVAALTKQMIQQVKIDRPGLVAKLRRMTVENGCTSEEAAIAKAKLKKILETT
jgi:hypothetical protein